MFDFTEFFEALRQRNEAVEEAARQAVNEFGQKVIGNAKEITPIESGALAASGTAEEAEINDGEVKLELGYGVAYAAARHERPPEDDAPPKINPKGVNKFLERTMKEMAPKFAPFVGGRIKAAMEA